MPMLVKQQSIQLIAFPVMWANLITTAKPLNSGMRKKSVSYREISTIQGFAEKIYVDSVYCVYDSVYSVYRSILFNDLYKLSRLNKS